MPPKTGPTRTQNAWRVSDSKQEKVGLGIWVGDGRARSAPSCGVLTQLSRRDHKRPRAAQLTRWGEKQIQEGTKEHVQRCPIKSKEMQSGRDQPKMCKVVEIKYRTGIQAW